MNPSAFRKITTHFNKYINLYKSKYPQDKFKYVVMLSVSFHIRIAIYSIITNQDPYNFPFSETFFPTIQDYIWYSLVNVLCMFDSLHFHLLFQIPLPLLFLVKLLAIPCRTSCFELLDALAMLLMILPKLDWTISILLEINPSFLPLYAPVSILFDVQVLLLLQNYNDAVRYLIYSNEYTLALNMALILYYSVYEDDVQSLLQPDQQCLLC